MSFLSRLYLKKRRSPELRSALRVGRELPSVLPVCSPRELSLDIVLRGQSRLQRIRTQTRTAESRQSTSPLDNWLSYTGDIDAHAALSLGFAAQELGLRVLNVAAPEGRFAIESLRLLRATANRFGLLLALAVKDEEHGYAVAHWADYLELQPRSQQIDSGLLRHLSGMGKGLVLKRTAHLRLKGFLDLVSRVRTEFHGELFVIESPKRDENGGFGFDSIHLNRLMEKGGARVLLDLQNSELSTKDRQALALSAIGSDIGGVVLPIDLSSYVADSFQDLAVTVRKMNALRYTLNAIQHIA